MHRTCIGVILGLLLWSQACHVTYYQKDAQFHQLFLANKLEEADVQLNKNKRAKRRKNRLLFYLNRGVIAHLMQRYEKSNYFFEQAYIIYENSFTKPLDEALTLVISATTTDYKGEDHEIFLLHYYKILNFLQLEQYSEALVECRRLNIRLNQLGDKYKKTNKYRRDAFIHTLMGLVYQANHEYNDAFIAYRNAIEIYQEDYKRLFGLSAPEQLKKDLLYTAYKTGLHDQVDKYQQEFKLRYDPVKEPMLGDAVFLWNNGLGPVKDAWSIDFVLGHDVGGVATFSNEELGLFFSFPLPVRDDSTSIVDLELIRVAFPKYRERPLIYDQACILTPDGKQQTLEILEDVNSIASQVLRQRMVLELSKSLLKVALKKVAEHQIRKQSEALGILVKGINFVTEKADTRNWQTIPHSIYYTRIRLPEGMHQVAFRASSGKLPCIAVHRQEFCLASRKDQTLFHIIHSPIAALD